MGNYLLFLLIALSPFSAFAEFTWSIDCGASGSYVDGNGITWKGDDTLISAGQPRTVQATNHVAGTLRVFTAGQKNCYVLEGENGAKLLVRANFLYGNYDGKLSPPSFGLQLDGNSWVKVEIDAINMNDYIYYEIIYIAKGDSISVCLVQTNSNQYPFISALEVRTLESKMYQFLGSDQALLLARRHAYGADQSIRDKYDRIWTQEIPDGVVYLPVRSSASIIDTTKAPDNPPEAAVRNAVTTMLSSITGYLNYLESTPGPVYMNFYFTEVSLLDPTEKRSFFVHLEDNKVGVGNVKEVVRPPYGSVDELVISKVTASNTATITLMPTSDSTLPPIISALEVFHVIDYTVYSEGTSSPGTSSGGGGKSPSSTSSTDSEKKNNRAVIIGIGIPSLLLLVAFVVVSITMWQKRRRAAMAAATTTGGAAQESTNDNHNQYNMTRQNFGQDTMDERKVDIGQQITSRDDPNNQHEYGSPAPLLNQTH